MAVALLLAAIVYPVLRPDRLTVGEPTSRVPRRDGALSQMDQPASSRSHVRPGVYQHS
jgi:hypothetical protein